MVERELGDGGLLLGDGGELGDGSGLLATDESLATVQGF